jgi:DNA-binding CsgD family transcriptional regulator/tetratricopeptide (TPR) repeat protein
VAPALPRLHDGAVPSEDDRVAAQRAYAQRAWTRARTCYAAADAAGELDAAELEAWGLAAVLTGHYAESEAARERAHFAHLAAGDADGAARVAFWLGLALVTLRGEPARAGGWFGRMTTVGAAADGGESVWDGYRLVNDGMGTFFGGDAAGAAVLLEQASAVAERFDDNDLRLLAGNGHGQALLSLGELRAGFAKLDEIMVLATTTDACPQAVGLVSCAVINASVECMDVRRSVEWTEALTRWCDRQPGLVPFRGQCAVHRSELRQLRGSWDGAMAEITDVLAQLAEYPTDHSAGMAHYQHGELCRVRGEHARAEEAYREALRHGRDPQPGLALLRLSQGRGGLAVTSLRRALDELHYRKSARTHLLAAGVECGLAAGDTAFARDCASQLAELATEVDSPLLQAVDAVARGSLALADERGQEALVALREGLSQWLVIDAPYAAASCRILIAQACRMLGDEETAELEREVARSTFAGLCGEPETERLMAVRVGPAAREGTAPNGLTARELEVLRLVATGASNRTIAEALFLSQKTVARHVANIFAKIDVSSRAAAAAYAHAHRLA